MNLLLLIILLILLFGGGGYYGYSHYPAYGAPIGFLEVIFIVCVVIYLFRRGD